MMMRRLMAISTLLFVSPFAFAEDDTPFVSLRGTPRALEPVNMEAYFEYCDYLDKVEFTDGVFNVVVKPATICFGTPPEGLYPYEFTLGSLPAGTYRARVIYGTEIASEMTFTVEPPTNRDFDALRDYSGIWWDANRNGESIFVEHETRSNRLLLVWNSYDAAGNQQWLVGLPDSDTGDGNPHYYSLALYRPSRAGLQRAGTARFERVAEQNIAGFEFQFTGGEPTRTWVRRFVGDRTQTYANEEDYAINDYATVESPIAVSGRSGNASSNASVSIDIRHTDRGDLKVDLVAPDGSLYNIHDRSNDSSDNVFTTVTLDLSSEAFNGTWKLRAEDHTGGDAGYVDSWSITF